jgi:hypothetical protein
MQVKTHGVLMLRYLSAALFALLFLHSVRADAETAAPTRQELDARIAEVESALIQHQARHFQAKHQRAYGDTNLAPVRVASREAESGIIALRRSLDERVRILDADIREQQSVLARQRKELADLGLLDQALQREIALAEGITGAAELVASLSAEREQAFAQREALALTLRDAEAALTERTKAVIATDAEATALQGQLTAQEAAFAAADGGLQRELDRDEAVVALTEERQALTTELQRLRAQRATLAPGGE